MTTSIVESAVTPIADALRSTPFNAAWLKSAPFGKPVVPEMHGTAVAGHIGARAGYRVGIEGVAAGARVRALRACWDAAVGVTECDSFSLGKPLNAAIMRDAQIIHHSIPGPPDRL